MNMAFCIFILGFERPTSSSHISCFSQNSAVIDELTRFNHHVEREGGGGGEEVGGGERRQFWSSTREKSQMKVVERKSFLIQ